MPPVPPADPGSDAAGFAAARDICRRHARGLYYASAFLRRPKRDAVFAVVAFCQMIREAMDAPGESLEGAAGLRHHPIAAQPIGGAGHLASAFKNGEASSHASCSACGPTGSLEARVGLLSRRLDEMYDGRLELPRLEARSDAQHAQHAFAATARRFGIPRQYFLDLAQGLRADAAVSRYATWPSLERHCRAVTGSVALATLAVLGVTHSGAGEQAVKLAAAMRLTAILRDLKRDFAAGTLYLPLEDLARFRHSERDLARGTVNDNFRELIRFETARARGLYAEGAEGLSWLGDDGSRLAVSALIAASSGVLNAIERERFDVLTHPPRLTAGQALRRLPLAWRLSRRRPEQPLPAAFLPAG